MALEEQLPRSEWHNTHGRRTRVLRRHGRQLLCSGREQWSAALGPETGGRGRRRSDYVCGQWFTKGGRGSGPELDRVANGSCHREDRDPWTGRTCAVNCSRLVIPTMLDCLPSEPVRPWRE